MGEYGFTGSQKCSLRYETWKKLLLTLRGLMPGGGDDHEDVVQRLKGRLREQLDMEGYFEVLKKNGAFYYADPGECPDIVHLGLLEAPGTRNLDSDSPSPGGMCVFIVIEHEYLIT